MNEKLRNVLFRTEPWKKAERDEPIHDARMWFIMRTMRVLAEAVADIERKIEEGGE